MSKNSTLMDVFQVNGLKQPHFRSEDEARALFEESVAAHPFVNESHYNCVLNESSCVRDGNHDVVAVLIKGGAPSAATKRAANVLRSAPSRTSLRANIFGGEAPLSGIAGYYDYTGSPVELKCRKTSFTCEVINTWQDVFPFIAHISALYKSACPEAWEAQMRAVPDVVRIHDSPFSTLTVNQRFRTAKHTDSGDFDAGFGVLCVLEGHYEGLHLGLPDFGICFRMMPGDVLLFNTHHYHCNTELVQPNGSRPWDRLTCVLYYRAALGDKMCLDNYRRRLQNALNEGLDTRVDVIEETDNGDNQNRPAIVCRGPLSPFFAAAQIDVFRKHAHILQSIHARTTSELLLDLFLEKNIDCGGLAPHKPDELQSMFLQQRPEMLRPSLLGGFSEAAATPEVVNHRKNMLGVETLRSCLPSELFSEYESTRCKWLSLVAADWERGLCHNAGRTDFTWDNKGPMARAFFDLCEAASEVMLSLLGRDQATPSEENVFWLCFAAHLHDSTVCELKMPSSAVSMRKLNVKLKDYKFGGTRYYKDMPEDEQERRRQRKQRLSAHRTTAASPDIPSTKWLENDDFDYQCEDIVFDYAATDIPPPNDNPMLPLAATITTVPESTPLARAPKILVVLPDATDSGATERETDAWRQLQQYLHAGGEEAKTVRRLLHSPTVRLWLAAAKKTEMAGQLPIHEIISAISSFSSVQRSTGLDVDGIDISFVELNKLSTLRADIVIGLHILGCLDADEAHKVDAVQKLRQASTVATFVVECDTDDVDMSLLVPPLAEAATKSAHSRLVAAFCIRRFSGIYPLHPQSSLRSTSSRRDVQQLLQASGINCPGWYHFKRSPLHTYSLFLTPLL